MRESIEEVNRRAAYRVSPIAVDDLQFALLRGEFRFEPEAIADVSYRGASLVFQTTEPVALDSGDRVMVAIASARLAMDTIVDARVVSLESSGGRHTLALSFERALETASGQPRAFYQVFNRRSATRSIRVGNEVGVAAEVVVVDADGEEQTHAAGVRNLSVSGIGLSVDAAADAALKANPAMAVHLLLPGASEPLEVAARVCYRSVAGDSSGDGAEYGCGFDWAGTASADAIAEALSQFTLEQFERDFRAVAA